MAAVVACGHGAVLSHRSAAELWGIYGRDRRPSDGGGRSIEVIEVTTPVGQPSRRIVRVTPGSPCSGTGSCGLHGVG
jgi:hypothetical protein